MAIATRLTAEDLAALQQRRQLRAVPPAAIPRSSEPAPLSHAQERLWFLHRLEGGSPAYIISAVYKLSGSLDVASLHKALNAVVRRHDVLRTTLAAGLQVVAPADREFGLPLILVRDAETAMKCVSALRQQPFDLATGPLLRVALLRLNAEEHWLVLLLHHVIADAWSMGILRRELSAAYAGNALPPLSVQYADVAHWQRSQSLQQDLDFWQTQLAGAPTVLELPADRPRPATQSYRGARYVLLLDPKVCAEIEALGRRESATPFMTFLAAFYVLLHRYSGQDDLLVGSPIAGRTRPEMEPLIGLFANTLVLRGQLAGNPSFLTLLRRVRETCLRAFSHQALPFEKLVEALQPPRDLSRGPLVQVMFQVQSAWTAGFDFAGLTVERVPLESDTAKFDLTLDVLPNRHGQLQAVFEYATDLFDSCTIERLAQHWSTLLRGIANQPDARIGDLPLLDGDERRALASTNRTEVPTRCVHHLIEAQARRTPNALAVTHDGESLTYAELEQRATAFATRLRKRGVGPEERVGICMNRGLDLIVAVLGVWKAGGAFVPLDPSLPRERLDFLIADSGASLVLTDAELSHSNSHTKAVEPLGDNLAYVLYTSGSTGRPKGVMVTHASLANAHAAWEQAYQLQHTTTAHLQMAGFGFDVFVGDMVRALASGARLVLCPRETLLDPPALYSLLLREQIDCAEFVPSVLRGLMEYMTRRGLSLPAMRLLVVGSESWHPSDWHALAALVGPCTRLINSYGLTEATIDSTFAEQPGSIGHAFANTRTLVLDRYGNLAPIGVPGELHIGGVGLARGYVGRPELTATRFIPDVFSFEPGARLYRTGDLARVRADGELELLGRIDHQIKLRGVRIEPGEIEAWLTDYVGVREAVVIARDERLVAYWTPDSNEPRVAATDLRAFLRSRLPGLAVPSAFVQLDRLPRLPNRKLDRAALPQPPVSDEVYVPPRTPAEDRIATIWSEVLGVDRVGATDDFFALGGHSLLATRVISQVRSALGVEVPLRALFEEPLLSGFAARAASSTTARPPAIRAVAREAYRRGDA